MTSIALKNSDCMLAEYPFLGKQPGWEMFVKEFDKPRCIEKRLKARTAHRLKETEVMKEIRPLQNDSW